VRDHLPPNLPTASILRALLQLIFEHFRSVISHQAFPQRDGCHCRARQRRIADPNGPPVLACNAKFGPESVRPRALASSAAIT